MDFDHADADCDGDGVDGVDDGDDGGDGNCYGDDSNDYGGFPAEADANVAADAAIDA